VRFSVEAPSAGAYRVTAVRFYRAPLHPMVDNEVRVYGPDGSVVGAGAFTGEGGPSGVVDVTLREPVELVPGETYTAAYVAQDGHYAYDPAALEQPVTVGPITFPALAGTYAYDGGVPVASTPASYYVTPIVALGEEPPPVPPPPGDTTPPELSILEPADGATVPAGVAVYVRAAVQDDRPALRSASLVADGVAVASFDGLSSGSVVNLPVTLEAGEHTLEVVAEDGAGNLGRAAIAVTAQG
jgi:hypothetical protein